MYQKRRSCYIVRKNAIRKIVEFVLFARVKNPQYYLSFRPSPRMSLKTTESIVLSLTGTFATLVFTISSYFEKLEIRDFLCLNQRRPFIGG
jgi:hypothetical protein